jgi:hypothetical protein
LEIALYALFAVSAVASIWQFAEQPNVLPLDKVGTTAQEYAEVQISS